MRGRQAVSGGGCRGLRAPGSGEECSSGRHIGCGKDATDWNDSPLSQADRWFGARGHTTSRSLRESNGVMKLGAVGGVASTALVALSLVLTPALAASSQDRLPKPRQSFVIRPGGFTPAISDPRLAAELARRGVEPSGFRLTPATVALGSSNKAVRVAIRARAATPSDAVHRASAPSTLSVTAITPTVYDLGVSVGWKRFALSGDVDRVRGGAVPGGHETAQVGVSYALSRF